MEVVSMKLDSGKEGTLLIPVGEARPCGPEVRVTTIEAFGPVSVNNFVFERERVLRSGPELPPLFDQVRKGFARRLEEVGISEKEVERALRILRERLARVAAGQPEKGAVLAAKTGRVKPDGDDSLVLEEPETLWGSNPEFDFCVGPPFLGAGDLFYLARRLARRHGEKIGEGQVTGVRLKADVTLSYGLDALDFSRIPWGIMAAKLLETAGLPSEIARSVGERVRKVDDELVRLVSGRGSGHATRTHTLVKIEIFAAEMPLGSLNGDRGGKEGGLLMERRRITGVTNVRASILPHREGSRGSERICDPLFNWCNP